MGGKDMAMITIRRERAADYVGCEKLLDQAFGEARFEKTSERRREGRLPAQGRSFVATEGGRLDTLEHDVVRKPLHTPDQVRGRLFRHHALIGTVRLWEISAGADRPALLLG